MRLTVDAHNDTLMKIIDEDDWTFSADIGLRTDFHIDLDKLVTGQVDVGLFAAFTDDLGNPDLNNSRLLSMIQALDTTVAIHSDRMAKGYDYQGIINSIEAYKFVAVQTIEGAYSLNEKNAFDLLKQYHDLGVRVITLVWDHSNALGEGTKKMTALGEPTSGGLTALGKKVVRAMNELGILVDVSHMDEETFESTILASNKPLIATHSGAYSVKPHIRNLKDSQLKAIADSGGVVHVVFCRFFIGDVHSGVDVLVDHIEHIINCIGEDHVGLGSDFDGATMPVDIPDISYMQLVAKTMQNRGFSDSTIDKVMGLNSLRLLDEMNLSPSVQVDRSITLSSGDINRFEMKADDMDNTAGAEFWLNGIHYDAWMDASSNHLYSLINDPLRERFYVATFEYTDKSGQVKRTTRIIKTI
ncbi:MAG: membrane dipeptidase [Clostridia bacterium]|nr:membrane dipeptidase [Clostridia bacterium]